jgi:PBP1b-binding outer membrane lipoprotein LpoB
MKNLIKTMPIVATVALLVAGAFLFAGCEKEKTNYNSVKETTVKEKTVK